MKPVDELALWLDQERLLKFHLTDNDPLLLELVTHDLGELRVNLIYNETPELRAEYNEMYMMLVELLDLRIDKFARGIR